MSIWNTMLRLVEHERNIYITSGPDISLSPRQCSEGPGSPSLADPFYLGFEKSIPKMALDARMVCPGYKPACSFTQT